MQPYDYTIKQNPTQNFLGALQMAQQIKKMRAAEEAEKREIEQAKALQSDLVKLTEDPNPKAIANTMIKYPQIAEKIKMGWDTYSDAEKQDKIKSAQQAYHAVRFGRKDVAMDVINQQIEANKAEGREQEVTALETIRDNIENNPEAAQLQMGMILHEAMGSDDYLKAFSGQDEQLFAPTPAIDAQGNPIFFQGSKSGGVRKLEGVKPFKPTAQEASDIKLDEARNLAGIDLEMKPKIAAAIKEAEVQAKDRGETLNALGKANAALPGLKEVAAKLKTLSDVATYTTGGKVWDAMVKNLGFGSTKGATARKTMESIVDNQVLPLMKQTFGNAFTEREGERLRNTILDPDTPPEEKKASIDVFLEQKMRDIETMEREAGVNQGMSEADADALIQELLSQ